MKFTNKHLQNVIKGESQQLTARDGVDFFLSKRDDDVARWDPSKAVMVFTSDESIINCKMIQIDLGTSQANVLAEITSISNK